jgi:hypothetical protein
VIAAIVILTVAGLALVEVLTSYTRALATAASRERKLADEERLLAAHTLLLRPDLDLRLGERDVGPYVVGVQRPEPNLYRIAVGRSVAGGVEDLVTVVLRREETDAP